MSLHFALHGIQYLQVGLTLLSGVLLGVLVYLLITRKLRSQFSALFNYLAFSVVMVVVGLASYFYWCDCSNTGGPGGPTGPDVYAYVYISLNFMMVGLEFLVMYEVLVNALKPFSALIDLGKMLFKWAALFLLVAAFLTAFATRSAGPDKIMAAGTVVERSMRLMQCGLLMLFFLFERRLGLSWRTRCMSVALGLSVAGAVDLAISYLTGQFPSWYLSLSIVNTLCYIGMLSFWTVRFALPEKQQASIMDSPGKLIFQRWNEALAGYGYGAAGAPSTVESFLPGIEKTVDRVLARRVS